MWNKSSSLTLCQYVITVNRAEVDIFVPCFPNVRLLHLALGIVTEYDHIVTFCNKSSVLRFWDGGLRAPECVWSYYNTEYDNHALQWRHNGRDGVSNHQPHDCLLNRLSRCRSKKASKLRVTGLCAGKSPVTGEFPAQMPSNAEI